MRVPNLLDVALSPLHWVERSRGGRRLALLASYAVVATAVGSLGWWATGLWHIPDPGDTLGRDRARSSASGAAERALADYRRAMAVIKPMSPTALASDRAWGVTDWQRLDPADRAWVAANPSVIAPWLRATSARDATLPPDLFNHPEAHRGLGSLARLALMEGSRREHEGDLDGAWLLYRSALRASRHVARRGAIIQRLLGNRILQLAMTRARAWSEAPGLSGPQLRRALADLAECSAMTPPTSDMVRAEFRGIDDLLDLPGTWAGYGKPTGAGTGGWLEGVSIPPGLVRFARREPERSHRLLRLIAGNALAQCDRPASARPAMVAPSLLIWDHDEATPAAVRAVPPARLEAEARASFLGTVLPPFDYLFGIVDGEKRSLIDPLRVEMACRAYAVENGRPPGTYSDLLDGYLAALPDDYDPGEKILAPE